MEDNKTTEELKIIDESIMLYDFALRQHDFMKDLTLKIINSKCNINKINHLIYIENLFALNIACQHNNYEKVKLLIENGADVKYNMKNKLSALQYACQNNNLEIVKLLVENGADVNYTYYDKLPPIYETSDNNIKHYLRKHGAKYSFLGFKY